MQYHINSLDNNPILSGMVKSVAAAGACNNIRKYYYYYLY